MEQLRRLTVSVFVCRRRPSTDSSIGSLCGGCLIGSVVAGGPLSSVCGGSCGRRSCYGVTCLPSLVCGTGGCRAEIDTRSLKTIVSKWRMSILELLEMNGAKKPIEKPARAPRKPGPSTHLNGGEELLIGQNAGAIYSRTPVLTDKYTRSGFCVVKRADRL